MIIGVHGTLLLLYTLNGKKVNNGGKKKDKNLLS